MADTSTPAPEPIAPCPFCGSTEVYFTEVGSVSDEPDSAVLTHFDSDHEGFAVECTGCGAQGPVQDGHVAAAEVWAKLRAPRINPPPTEAGDIELRFTHHPPANEEVVARHRDLRRGGKDFAFLICACVPAGRERSLALTKIEEAVMWANAGVARKGK